MSVKQPIVSKHEVNRATQLNYIIGFVASLITTFISFILVGTHALSRTGLIAAVSALAIVQFIVQLVFFLHLGRETRPRWKLMVFWFMLLVVVIVVVGSIWIMTNLNYHMMPKEELLHHMRTEEGL